MAKYSYEFKKKVVLAYLNGEGGYKYLTKINGIPASRRVEQWVHNYNAYGNEGLMRSRKNKNYSFEKKLSIVELCLTSEGLYDKIKDIGIKTLIADAGYKAPAIAKLRIDDSVVPLFSYKRPQTKKGFSKNMSIHTTNTTIVMYVQTEKLLSIPQQTVMVIENTRVVE